VPLTKDAHALIVVIKMQCLAISLTLELNYLVSYKEAHIPATSSFVAISTYGGKNNRTC
jgi:hypothetical protein